MQEAREALQQFLSTAGPSTDIALVAEAAELLTGLENDTIKAGTVTPLYGAAPGTPSAAPPQNTTTPTTAPGKDTPSAPKALEPTKKDVASPPPRGAASNGKHPSQNSPAASPARTAAESKEHISTPERGESSQLAELDHMHRLLALGDPSSAIATAVNLVNDGKCKESVAMLDIIESRHGANVAVYATRGTAKALLGDLNGAIADFDAAIAREPQVCDFYKRRAQALAASGREVAALEDLLKVRNLAPDAASRAESYVESAKVHHKMRDYRKAELDLKASE